MTWVKETNLGYGGKYGYGITESVKKMVEILARKLFEVVIDWVRNLKHLLFRSTSCIEGAGVF